MSGIAEYHLEMEPEDLDWFSRHPFTERCFPCRVLISGVRHPGWIGYRGRFSRQFPKPSYDLWFEPGAGPDGQRCLHLNAAYRDPSLLRGRLAFNFFADIGVPVPAVSHGWVTLGGKTKGLYTVMESLNKAWLERHGAGGGTVYYGVGGEGNFGLISRRHHALKRYLAAGYEKCTPDNDDFRDLEEFIYQITMPEASEFAESIGEVLDVEGCLRWLAGIVLTSHTDGLVHNYALFRSPGGKWQFSPWDLDGTWGRCPRGYRLPADWMPIVGGGDNYLAARLLTSPRWRRRYREIWAELFEGPLAPGRIAAKLQLLYGEIREHALLDPYKWRRNSTFLREPAYIRHWVADRMAFIGQELKAWSTVLP